MREGVRESVREGELGSEGKCGSVREGVRE